MSPPHSLPRLSHFLPLGQWPERSVSWLWPGRLALGQLALLDGDPGLGKSLVTLDLCARLTTGRPFPDNSPCPEPANVIVLNAEDSPDQTIRPRLQSFGADLDRVYLPSPDDPEMPTPLRLPAQLDALERALAQHSARLVVIDPVTAFLDRSVNTASDQSVRGVLGPLAELAERHQCAVLLVRHLNKRAGARALYRGAGAISFVAACRSAWLIAPDPEQPERRVLAQLKNNLAPPQPSLAFLLAGSADGPPTITWLGSSTWQADQLLGHRHARPEQPSPREEACKILSDLLRDGPRTSREIGKLLREKGITKTTLKRAKLDLEIRSVRVWAGGQRLCYWLLPHQELPLELRGTVPQSGLEPYLEALRQKYGE